MSLFILLIVWRGILFVVEFILSPLIPLRQGYIHTIPWLNFDGMHYLSIAQSGYLNFQQAFFPLFPILIKIVSNIFPLSYEFSSLVISHVFTVLAIIALIQFHTQQKSINIWVLAFLLFFPTGFFLVAGYNTSLFLFLAISCANAAFEKKWLQAGIFGMLASATRLSGIFLFIIVLWEYFTKSQKKKVDALYLFLIPTGAIFYSIYLQVLYNDPLAFFHVQPAFGANRSGDSLILLPQVLWRYSKILFLVPLSRCSGDIRNCVLTFPYDWWISLLELSVLALVLLLIWYAFKIKYRPHYILYCLFVVLTPTLTGTLSSLPRYIFDAFPLFVLLGNIKQTKIKIVLFFLFIFCFITFTIAFLRGYFVA